MVVGRLGELGDAVDERDRGGEVREASTRARFSTSLAPARRSSISASVSGAIRRKMYRSWPPGVWGAYSRWRAHREPRPPRHRAAVRAGLGPEVVAVTHECDHPPAALALERVTRDVLPAGLSAAEIDAAVRERTLGGEAIYELDG